MLQSWNSLLINLWLNGKKYPQTISVVFNITSFFRQECKRFVASRSLNVRIWCSHISLDIGHFSFLDCWHSHINLWDMEMDDYWQNRLNQEISTAVHFSLLSAFKGMRVKLPITVSLFTLICTELFLPLIVKVSSYKQIMLPVTL